MLPASAYGWCLLGLLGLCGFVMQFMVTAGIGGERSNRATAMAYTQMVFAAGFDRWVFGHRMGGWSLLGCGLVVGGALWVVFGKAEGRVEGGKGEGDVESGGRGGEEEGIPMLVVGEESESEDEDEESEEEDDDDEEEEDSDEEEEEGEEEREEQQARALRLGLGGR